MATTISNGHSTATEETNTTGVMDPILTIDPVDGTYSRFANMVSVGAALGIPIIADLRDGSDNPLPTDTELLLEVERPTDESPVAVSVKVDNISAWNQLTTSEQRNDENVDSVKVELKDQNVYVNDVDELHVSIRSSAQIDWSNSELYFPWGVSTHDLEG